MPTFRGAAVPAVSALIVVFLYSGLLVVIIGAQSIAPRRGGNPEAAKVTNPVPATPDAIAAGRKTYARLCVRCHGPEGKGDGGGAGAGGQPADFTDATWDFGSSDGDIFAVIRDGTSADMEAYGERISQAEIWQLVHFVKSLSGKK